MSALKYCAPLLVVIALLGLAGCDVSVKTDPPKKGVDVKIDANRRDGANVDVEVPGRAGQKGVDVDVDVRGGKVDVDVDRKP